MALRRFVIVKKKKKEEEEKDWKDPVTLTAIIRKIALAEELSDLEFKAVFMYIPPMPLPSDILTDGRIIQCGHLLNPDRTTNDKHIAKPAIWTLANHHKLSLPAMNKRAMMVILCLRRSLGRRVRPLHFVQIMRCMKYVVVRSCGVVMFV